LNKKELLTVIEEIKKDALNYLENEHKEEVRILDDDISEDATGKDIYEAVMDWDLSTGYSGESAVFETGVICACNQILRSLGEKVI